MKRRLIIAAALLCSMHLAGQVKVSNVEVKQNGNKAEITFDAQIDKDAAGGNYKLVMTPVMFNGSKSLTLAPIEVGNRRTRILDARNNVVPVPNTLMTANGKSEHYKAVADYQSWLSGADMRLDMVKIGCCSDHTLPSMTLASSVVPGEVIVPKKPVVETPEASSVRASGIVMILEKNASLPAKYDQITPSVPVRLDRVNVVFERGSSVLNPSLYDNYRELQNIISAISSSADFLAGKKIEITGYASPEGTQSGNYYLAERRALAVRDYILANVSSLRTSNFDVVNGGENWEELYKMVQESQMPNHWQVLDVIERIPTYTDHSNKLSRKKILMDMNGGNTWRYMLANFFPRLRSAVSVTIYMKNGEAPVYATAQSANDAALVKINRAIDLIGERNTSLALVFLAQVEDDPRAWNPMAVCYFLENNIAKAKEYFRKSADAGYTEARGNLNQIQ